MTTVLHFNMCNKDYHSATGINKSLLDMVHKSPLHAKNWLDGDRPEPTDAMLFGTAFHSLVLEPELFEANYATFWMDRRTTAGKAAYAALIAQGKTIITNDDMYAIKSMKKSVMGNIFSRQLIESESVKKEVSVFIDQSKCRPDMWDMEGGILIDLKTTEDASPSGFARSAAQYRYHVQAAHYMDLTGADRFIFLAVEKKRPYAMGIYELDYESLKVGRRERDMDLNTYLTCFEFDRWPGYGDEIQTITLPRWALGDRT